MSKQSMVLESVCCPDCHKTHIVKHGKSAELRQRYRCRNSECSRHNFILNYSDRAYPYYYLIRVIQQGYESKTPSLWATLLG
ncbi:IS1 family transposase [Chroococcidiopsis sp. FACHB-1243]|uniref:IS1 family transposase n=1 Tax=Chroococcidiopsis sp. [FACHB-1243] TaxID=2692781 RepID=UPI0017828902|nr:IS1 family transposase [Chroococcidiopsis sp. [FACHB-1243]]MBD2309473.1 IS1 family transposase [Chroococcidiopsis sp. [FACHB-1243]]